MSKKFISYLLFFIWGCLLITGCSKSDDQRKFEDEAFTTPEGYTRTQNDGTVENTDQDDWRISPMYRGLISIGFQDSQPPYPNPVNYNSTFTVQLEFNTSDYPVNALDIRKFRYPTDNAFPQVSYLPQDQLNIFNTITIQAKSVAAGQGSSANGLYRLLIYDQNQNLITYGDIQVQ